jgi:hypothetical protein
LTFNDSEFYEYSICLGKVRRRLKILEKDLKRVIKTILISFISLSEI